MPIENKVADISFVCSIPLCDPAMSTPELSTAGLAADQFDNSATYARAANVHWVDLPNQSYDVIKRCLDFGLALVLGIGALPLCLLIATAILLTCGGPVLFWSVRVGKDDHRFHMAKFRTMSADAPLLPTARLNSPERYLTPLGRWLRKSSLDELPQLFNILKGEMSLVGPRPVIESETELLEHRAESRINGLLPGLTGWAQINGRDHVPVENKVKLDRHYLRNRSIRFDFEILLRTAWKVIRHEDIAH